MLAVLIGVLTILTWHFTTVYTTKSIESLAYSLRMDILDRCFSRMGNVLNTTMGVTVSHTNLVKYVFSRHTTLADDDEIPTVMRNITWAIFSSQLMVSSLTVVYNNGITQGYERDDTDPLEYYSYSLPSNQTIASGAFSPVAAVLPPALSPTASASDPAEDFVQYAGSDAFLWYRQQVDNNSGNSEESATASPASNYLGQDFRRFDLLIPGAVAWHATVHNSSAAPFLVAGSSVRDPVTGKVLAVTGTRQELTSVNNLMKQLVALHSGTIYLTNMDGYLLASSTSTPLLKINSTGPALIMAEESTDRIIKSGAAWLRVNYGMGFENLQNVNRENVVLLGDRYYINTFVLNLTELPLVGVIVTPRSSVLGEVDRRGHATLAILISISVCFLVVGCFCTLLVTTGVSNAMKLRMELIDHLEARRRAEASSTYKSQFLANMSHELRTPMAAVIGLLDILLSDEYMTSEQVAMVSQIRQCSTALLRLLNNILDLSKVESGKLVLEQADFDLRRELEGLVDMFSVQCSDQQIEIVLDLSDDLPRMLRGDSARTVQIFANLIANSIKFTASGRVLVRGRCESSYGTRSELLSGKSGRLSWGGQLDVQSPRMSAHGHSETEDNFHQSDKICVWFEVDDTGCGIDPRKWESVFDSFVQADPSTTRTYGGTGLGLCIVRSLVRKMGGEIKVVQKDGPGTMLKFNLCFKRSPESPFIQKNFEDYCSSTFMSKSLQQAKILFSLQGETGRTVMGKWMGERGLRVTEAATWEDTIAKLEELVLLEDESLPRLQPLAILDFSLVPKESGLDALHKYVKKGLPIGWLLNHDTSSTVKGDLRKRGYSIMANKPVYKSKLVHLLRMLVGISKDEDSSLCRKALRSPSFGPLGQISKHKFEVEAPSISDPHRRSKSGQFPIFKPSNYLQPELISLSKPKSPRASDSITKGGAVDASQPPRETSAMETGPPPSEILQNGGVMEPRLDETQQRDDPSVLANRSSTAAGRSDVLLQESGREQRSPEIVEKEKLADNDTKVKEMAVKDPGTPGTLSNQAVEIQRLSLSETAGQSTPRVGPHVCDEGASTVINTDPQKQREVITDDPPKPVTPPRNSAVPMRQQRQLPSAGSSRFGPRDALKGVRILLAEDTPVLQRVATMMLERLGATVIPVADGLQAVDALTTSLEDEATDVGKASRVLKYPDMSLLPYDLVLMDCQMPKMDGYDATRAIREAEQGTNCHIPIVALTAHAMSSDEAKCLAVGMDAYLTKPIDQKLMLTTITSFTKSRRPPAQEIGVP